MSARIRTSSLFSRKYDWIFCESIKPQRPRALHSLELNEALLRMRKVLDESRPAGQRRLPISKIPTKPGSKAEKARIHRVAVDTPVRPPQFVRPLKGRSRLGTSGGRISGHVSQDGRKEAVITGEFEDFNEIPYTVRRLDGTEKPTTPAKLARWALLRGEQLRRPSAKRDSSIESQEGRIWRYQTREEDPHKQTFRISKHLTKDPDNPPVFRPESWRRVRGAATTATKAWTSNGEARNLRVLRYRSREVDPHKLATILKVPTSVRIRKIGGPLNMEKLPEAPPKPKSVADKPLQSHLKPAKSAMPLQPLRTLPQPDAPVKSLNLEQAQGQLLATAEPAEPLDRIDRNQVRYAGMDPKSLNRLSYSAKAKFSKRELKNVAEALRREELGKGSQEVTTEEHSPLRALPTETSPSTEYAQQNVIRRAAIQTDIRPTKEVVPPLKVRKHLSVALKDRPFENSEAQKVAEQDRVAKLKGTLQVVPSPEIKIIKYGSTRLRKHISERTTFAQPVIDLQDSRFEQPFMISGLELFTVPNVVSAVDLLPPTTIRRVMASDSVPEGEVQPLTIERPENLVVQKVAKKVSKKDQKVAEKAAKKAAKQDKMKAKKLKNEVKKLERQAKEIEKKEAKRLAKAVAKGSGEKVKKKVATSPKEAQQPAIIRRAVGFDSVPEGKGQPLTIKRPENLVVQKVATSQKKRPDPPEKPTDSLLIRAYMSTSQYPIPTEETRMFSEVEPEREPIKESPPASTHDWTPTERIEHAVEVASSKRLQRESWLTRKGDMRLAISLLFSSRSMANVQRLRWEYNPNKEKFANFKVLRRLEIGSYNEYATMLASFVQTWQPFSVKLNEPGHTNDKKSSFKVGLKLELEKLEQLEKALLESVQSLPGTARVNRRNTRDNDELGLMVIDGKIKEAQDAAQLVELLKKEHEEGLGSLRAEGLLLHGYANGGDSLFPPPKEFLFPGVERTIQKSEYRSEILPLGRDSMPRADSESLRGAV
jgi:hypothetical protein